MQEVHGDLGVPVGGLALDSREVGQNYVFAALPGTKVDGRQFIAGAIQKGAKVIITTELPEAPATGVTYLISSAPAKLLALMTAAYYDHPTRKFDLVGVTGTNGKTTVATLLYQLFTKLGYKCGLVATTGILIAGQKIEATHTTPDSVHLNK